MVGEQRVIIVGAGPVGLMSAIRLSEAGIPTLLCEAEPGLPHDLRASTWHPPTLDMLQPYGLTDRLIDAGLISPTWQIRHHETGDRAVFDLSVLSEETDHPFRLQCEQHKFGRFALDWLHSNAETEVRFSTRAVGVDQDADGVTLRVEHGGATETVRGRYLIGADGAKSTIREAVGLALFGRTYPETTFLATTTFPFHEHMEGLSNVNYVWSPTGTYSLLRLPGVWRASLYPDEGETADQAVSPEAIEAKLQRIVPKDTAYEVLEVRPYRIHQRIVDTYRVGRVLLAGDAAHLNSPSGGMGMNGGLHDAFCLTDLLIQVWRGADPTLLDRYTRQRRPIAEQQILAQADRNRARMHERDPERRRAHLVELQAIANDPVKSKGFLLRSSMIEGLRRAAAVN
ncbi:MAG: NAD(P)/FAD-dependent oxidoreductase [Pseudomonadota bacterium]